MEATDSVNFNAAISMQRSCPPGKLGGGKHELGRPDDAEPNVGTAQVRQDLQQGYLAPPSVRYGALRHDIARALLHTCVSRPFDRPRSGPIAAKVINYLGDEALKVFQT